MMPPFPPDEDDPWRDHQVSSNPPPRSHNPTWVRKTKGLVLGNWSPQPLPPPQVDAELRQFSVVERSAEVFRYTFSKAEYWMSPGGWLREWIRLNLRLAAFLLVPSLLVVPLVTCALQQFSTWTDLLATTTSKMILFPLSALLVVGLICGLVYLGKSFQQRPRPRSSPYE